MNPTDQLLDDLCEIAWGVFNHDNDPRDDRDPANKWNWDQLRDGFRKVLTGEIFNVGRPGQRQFVRQDKPTKHRCKYRDADKSLPFNGGLNPKVCVCGRRKIWASTHWIYKAAPNPAKEIKKSTRVDRRYVKRLRALGASDHEIALALNIPESSLLFDE